MGIQGDIACFMGIDVHNLSHINKTFLRRHAHSRFKRDYAARYKIQVKGDSKVSLAR
jgi:hypothetical protein